MNEDEHELPESLRRKFPDMRPVKRPPTLYTLNGIGLTMSGRRDYDAESHTYVKTHCICLIFIPIIAEETLTRLKQDKAGRLIDQLQFRLNPLSGTLVIEQYWTSRMNHNDSAATQIYRQALKDGVPLPPFNHPVEEQPCAGSQYPLSQYFAKQ